jgi:hypothetical protein
MTQDKFKELFDKWHDEWLGEYKRDFYIYISYFQEEKTEYYYDRGYRTCMEVGYPDCIQEDKNPYKKDELSVEGCSPYDDFENGWTDAWADLEYSHSINYI